MKSKCDLKASGYCLETCHEKCQRSVGERQEKGERLQDLGRMNLFTFFFFFFFFVMLIFFGGVVKN